MSSNDVSVGLSFGFNGAVDNSLIHLLVRIEILSTAKNFPRPKSGMQQQLLYLQRVRSHGWYIPPFQRMELMR